MNPTRVQLNSFARLLRQETSLPSQVLTEAVCLHAWHEFKTPQDLSPSHVERMIDEMDWTNPYKVGVLAATQVQIAVEKEKLQNELSI